MNLFILYSLNAGFRHHPTLRRRSRQSLARSRSIAPRCRALCCSAHVPRRALELVQQSSADWAMMVG